MHGPSAAAATSSHPPPPPYELAQIPAGRMRMSPPALQLGYTLRQPLPEKLVGEFKM